MEIQERLTVVQVAVVEELVAEDLEQMVDLAEMTILQDQQ
jgi:hypothetical protein